MIVLDVWLGPTHQNRGRQSSWSECLSRFCCGQIQPPEKQSQPVVGRKSSTFPLRLWTKTCMRMMMDPLTIRKNWSMFAFIASKSALAWRWKFKKWEWGKKNSQPAQALTGLIVVLVQEWTQQPRRLRHLGGDQVQEESWWEEEVQGLPGQKDPPCFFNAPWQGRCSQSRRQGPISKR